MTCLGENSLTLIVVSNNLASLGVREAGENPALPRNCKGDKDPRCHCDGGKAGPRTNPSQETDRVFHDV
jgi:hypothetical protein